MKRFALYTLLVLSLAACQGKPGEPATEYNAEPASRKPLNILFILIDDLNADVGFLGSSRAVTPNLDDLAGRSLVFERAYAQAPLCNPSRTSLMTGTYPHFTGIYGLKPNFWEVPELAGLNTLPGYFRQAGYYTGAVGKVFHTAAHADSFDVDRKGWFGAFGPFPPEPLRPDTGEKFHPYYDWGPWLEEEETADYKLATAAIDMLREAQEQDSPFFLTVGFFRPHNPRYAPQEFFDMHPLEEVAAPPREVDATITIPEFGRKLVSYDSRQRFNRYLRSTGGDREYIQAYRASISLVDRQVGRLLDLLEDTGLIENTLVVLASDHGVQNGEKNLWLKRTLWEASNRVPLLISSPYTATGSVMMPVGLIDIFPTLVELARLENLPQLQGESLAPWLDISNRLEREDRAPVLSEHGPGNFSLRSRNWRYIRYQDGSEELYNHQEDSGETNNLVLSAPSDPGQ